MPAEVDGRLAELRSLRDEIAALGVVKCRMSHERVVRDPASGLPVVQRVPEGSYRRIGLCSPERRATQLGCSHTAARVKLKDAIAAIAAAGHDAASAAALDGELRRLDNEIHLLDHRKGEAEKSLATAALTAQRETREIDAAIREMEALHDRYVDEIADLRRRVVQAIDDLALGFRLARGPAPGERAGPD